MNYDELGMEMPPGFPKIYPAKDGHFFTIHLILMYFFLFLGTYVMMDGDGDDRYIELHHTVLVLCILVAFIGIVVLPKLHKPLPTSI